MELVKQFNSELSSLYESKPPISKAKMTSITRTAIKAIKLYKHVVQSVEKFIQKCKPEYKVPGLYVIDSIVRQSRHQFGTEKDVFAPRFARNLQQTFLHLFNCPPDDKSKVIRVLNLWQKNAVFESEVIQPLFDLADPNHPVHKEQAALAPTNGITQTSVTPKNVSSKKEGGTAGWVNQLPTESNTASLHSTPMKAPSQLVDVNILHQLQQLQSLLLDQQSEKVIAQNKEDQVKFDKKLLDFDYGEEEDEIGTPAQHHHHQQQQQQQQQVVAGLDSIGSILSNPEVLRQLQTLQQTLSNPQQMRQQQFDMEEKMRKMQEMKQQEEEFDKHLAQTVPNLPFADECELKPGGELSGFPGMDLSQPPPGYPSQQKLLVPPGMMLKPPPSPLEDGEHASSDADERIGRTNEDGGPSVVVLDSDSPSNSPSHSRRRRRRSRSRSRSHRRSRSDSRSRSRNKRKRSSSFDDKDWERVKQREAEKERERERKRKGLPLLKKNHLAVCSTTLWIGHLSKLVQQEELSDTFGEFGDIVSIDLIPPRGCAFICMNRRQDAYRALQDLKHHKLQGKAITLAWAPGKGMKGKEYKDYWEVDQGVSYIPWSKLSQDIDLDLLEEGGMIDEESLPEWLKEKQKKSKDDEQHRSLSSSQAEDDDASKGTELDIPVPAPTLPGYIPLPEGPQPTEIKVSQPPPSLPTMMAPAPPLGMMPPFGLPNVPRLLGPMGMAMGPGLMPNVPLGVPPPGLMSNPLMHHQQMLSRMPQPVGSPFNPPPGVGILGGHHQLSQIPLPGSQDKPKTGLTPLAVPPPSDPFGDSMLQIPFSLPPQLQMPGMSMLTRPPVNDKQADSSMDNKGKSPSRMDPLFSGPPQFGQPPPLFSPTSLMKIPPPMSIPPPNKQELNVPSSDKDERELKDKDYRDSMKDYKDREKERDRDRDYRNKRDRDYRGDRDYRDRFDKDYRERDKDYRDKDRDRKDRRDRSREREKEDKMDQDFRDKDSKMDEKDRKDDMSKDDKNYREREKSRNRDRDRDRDRDRGRDRMNKWGDRDRDRGRDRDRDDKRSRDRDRSKEMKGNMDREKNVPPNLQDRMRPMAHDQDRGNDFPRGAMETDNFQGQGGMQFGPRNEGFSHDGFPDMHGRHPNNRRDGFDNRGPRDMYDHRGPPPDRFDSRGPHPEGFGPRGGPPLNSFGPRGPPSDGFPPRGPPPEGFDPRGPPPGNFGPPEGFDPRGPPPDFDSQGPPSDNFKHRGPPENFKRALLPDNFGPGGPPPEFRGPPADEFGPHGHPPFEGFGGPHGPPGEFQPRIRIEFFARGRGRGGLQDSFRGRGSPRGARGPRPGIWMENQGPSPPKPGFGFPHRGFAPSEAGAERFASPIFEDMGRGQNMRGRGRGFPSRQEEQRREDEDNGSSISKRLSRWSNPSPPPAVIQPSNEERSGEEITSDIQTIDMQSVNDSGFSISKENLGSNQVVTAEIDTEVRDDHKEHGSEPNTVEISKEAINQVEDVTPADLNPSVLYQSISHDSSNALDDDSSFIKDDKSSVLNSSTNDTLNEQRVDSDLIQDVNMSEIHLTQNENVECIKDVPSFSDIGETSSAMEGHDHFDIGNNVEMSLERRLPLHEQNVDSVMDISIMNREKPNITEGSYGESIEPIFNLEHQEALPFEKRSQESAEEQFSQDKKLLAHTSENQDFDVFSQKMEAGKYMNFENETMQDIQQRLPLVDVLDNQNSSTNHEAVDFDEMELEPPPNDFPSQESLLSAVTPNISDAPELHELSQSTEENNQ